MSETRGILNYVSITFQLRFGATVCTIQLINFDTWGLFYKQRVPFFCIKFFHTTATEPPLLVSPTCIAGRVIYLKISI